MGRDVRDSVRRRCGTAARCRTALFTADTATVCRCPRLQEPDAWPASAGGVQPPPIRPADLAGQPPAELLAHIGHGRPLQRQGLLGGQPAELEAPLTWPPCQAATTAA